MKGLLLL